jgi:hypothetical protein
MTEADESRQQIIEWLKERGHDETEVAYILNRLNQYDKLTTVDALMDAIAQGEVDLESYVEEVRKNGP